MLSLWKLRRQLEPLRSDCVVSRHDGIDITTLLQQEIDDWYETLLDTAPNEMLVATDIASQVAVNFNDDNSASISLPIQCRRVIEVMADSWKQPATITNPQSALALRQANPFSRAGSNCPVAIKDFNTLRLYGIAPQSKLTRLLCVMHPDDGFYEFSKRALSTIPQP